LTRAPLRLCDIRILHLTKKSAKEAAKMYQASKEILRFWKTQWESYMKSMMAMQEQGESMLEMI